MAGGLDKLNQATPDDTVAAFLKACGSTRWAKDMAAGRPYTNPPALLRAADAAMDRLTTPDWLEAFAHHPRIGEKNLSQPMYATTKELSNKEQSGMATATKQVREAFADANEEYERRFGRVFLICAMGKTADQMLAALRERLKNDDTTEMTNAIREQRLITRLRLEKLA